MHTLYHGDAIEVLKGLADNSIDAVITDPPSGISFMGLSWDNNKGGRDQWIDWLSDVIEQCYRVLKPGGHAFVWSLPRTSHWTGMALELAGFEVRDLVSHLYDSSRDVQAFLETLSPEQRQLLEIILANSDDTFTNALHVFGSGFPKSLNVGRAIDQHLGMEREIIGISDKQAAGFIRRGRTDEEVFSGVNVQRINETITAPASPEAKAFSGWGSSLKPAFEQWWLVRKPLSEPTIAANVLKWGTGGLNIDGTRIPTNDDEIKEANHYHNPNVAMWGNAKGGASRINGNGTSHSMGRFPSNLIHDGSEPVEAEFAKAGVSASKLANRGRGLSTNGSNEGWKRQSHDNPMYQNYERGHNDTGAPSRFFYCAKPSSRERNEGLEGFEEVEKGSNFGNNGARPHTSPDYQYIGIQRNIHPTVKSIALCEYLTKMTTPKGGTVLDCFMGSGTTGVAAIKNGFNFIGIEKERNYFEIAEARIRHVACGQAGEIIAPEPLPVTKPKLQPSLF